MAADWKLRDTLLSLMGIVGTSAVLAGAGMLWNVNGTLVGMAEKQTATNDRLTSLEVSVKDGTTQNAALVTNMTQLISGVVERQNMQGTLIGKLIEDVARLKERTRMEEEKKP